MDDKHWLERPENITKLWRGGWVLLALLVLAEFTYHPHAYFVIDGWSRSGIASRQWCWAPNCWASI